MCAVALVGCASSYKSPVDLSKAKVDPVKVAEARQMAKTMEHYLHRAEAVALSNESKCERKGPRMPFYLMSSPPWLESEMRDAFAVAAQWREQPRLIALRPVAQPFQGKFVTHLGSDKVLPDHHYITMIRAIRLAKEGKPVVLGFSDGTTASFEYLEGCLGLTLAEPMPDMEPLNSGLGLESLPLTFVAWAQSDDEELFLMGRSLYFTSGEGGHKLRVGAAVGRFVRGMTDIVSGGLIKHAYNAQEKAPGLVRARYLNESDAFGLEAAVRAGADPRAILAFVERLSQPALKDKLPSDLVFTSARVAALRKVAAPFLSSPSGSEPSARADAPEHAVSSSLGSGGASPVVLSVASGHDRK